MICRRVSSSDGEVEMILQTTSQADMAGFQLTT